MSTDGGATQQSILGCRFVCRAALKQPSDDRTFQHSTALPLRVNNTIIADGTGAATHALYYGENDQWHVEDKRLYQ